MSCFKSFRYLASNGILHQNYSVTKLPKLAAKMSTTSCLKNSDPGTGTFQNLLPCVIDSVTNNKHFNDIPNLSDWAKRVIEYNATGGKMNRGLTTVLAYQMLEKPEKVSEELLRDACIMGWCVELFHASFVIADDIMDGATTRRGVPCWYHLPGVHMSAVNDTIFMQSALFQMLKKHFQKKPYYWNVIELFTDELLCTSIGQHLDLEMCNRQKKDFTLFTSERYEAIVKYKASSYTHKLPVSLGLYLTNCSDEVAHKHVEDISIDIGLLYQIQDDYLDCYGEEEITGKQGTDIKEGKCTWLALTALQHCSPAKRIVFETCYGSKEPAHIDRIKVLYNQLKIPQLYKLEERKLYERIMGKIDQLPDKAMSQLFVKLTDMIYKRNF